MNGSPTTASWFDNAREFLTDLVAVQGELSAALRDHHLRRSGQGNNEWPPLIDTDRSLIQRLEQCYQRRIELLRSASQAGLPAQTLRTAAAALPETNGRLSLQALLNEAEAASRRLRLAGLTHWMLAQRSLAHVS